MTHCLLVLGLGSTFRRCLRPPFLRCVGLTHLGNTTARRGRRRTLRLSQHASRAYQMVEQTSGNATALRIVHWADVVAVTVASQVTDHCLLCQFNTMVLNWLYPQQWLLCWDEGQKRSWDYLSLGITGKMSLRAPALSLTIGIYHAMALPGSDPLPWADRSISLHVVNRPLR